MKGLLHKGHFLTKVDLENAYLSVPLDPAHRNFVAFHWAEQLWKFKTQPFGLSSALYAFTNLTKPRGGCRDRCIHLSAHYCLTEEQLFQKPGQLGC